MLQHVLDSRCRFSAAEATEDSTAWLDEQELADLSLWRACLPVERFRMDRRLCCPWAFWPTCSVPFSRVSLERASCVAVFLHAMRRSPSRESIGFPRSPPPTVLQRTTFEGKCLVFACQRSYSLLSTKLQCTPQQPTPTTANALSGLPNPTADDS